MFLYLIKRLLLLIPTLFGITLVTFFIIRFAPGSPVTSKIQALEALKAETVAKEAIDQLTRLYGLEVNLPPWYSQWIDRTNARFLGVHDPEQRNWFKRSAEWTGKNWIQYTLWIDSLAHLDFGISLKDQRPVIQKIKEALPITLTLNTIEIVIVYLVSVPLGIFSALRRDSVFDKVLMVKLFLLHSMPTFWVAIVLIMLFSNGDALNWFPAVGFSSDGAELLPWYQQVANIGWHLVLPVICMVYGSFAYLARFSRGNFLEIIRHDYVRTAFAKGLSRRQVIWKHAFRNALIPFVTLVGMLLPALLGGSVIIEQIFSIPGMGKLGFEAMLSRDYPTLMTITTFSAFLTLISILLSDLLYLVVDPRISFESVSS